MTIEEAIKYPLGAEVMFLNRNPQKMKEAIIMAFKALEEKQARENPEPLTIEEMKQMDGEPVFVVPINDQCMIPEWCVYEDRDKIAYAPGNKHWYWGLIDYGETWIAYRHKPKEK